MSALQLLVARRGLDPAAWTALDTLRRAGLGAHGLARATLWEFESPGGLDADAERELSEWVASANRFANPNRDLARWRRSSGDGTGLAALAVRAGGGLGVEENALGAHLVTWAREGSLSEEDSRAATRQLGRPLRVRHGIVWALAAENGSAVAMLRRAGGDPAGGLLANPHAEVARLTGAALPLPAFSAEPAAAHSGGNEEIA